MSPSEVYALIILSAIAMGLQAAVGRAILAVSRGLPGLPFVPLAAVLALVLGLRARLLSL